VAFGTVVESFIPVKTSWAVAGGIWEGWKRRSGGSRDLGSGARLGLKGQTAEKNGVEKCQGDQLSKGRALAQRKGLGSFRMEMRR